MAERGLNGAVTTAAMVSLFGELGTTGLKAYSGFVREEFRKDLIGLRGIRTYAQMATDDMIGAVLYANEMLCRQVPWMVTPSDSSNLAAEHASLVHGMLFDDMSQSWSMFLSECLSFQIYGWAYHELVLKRRSGAIPPAGYVAGDPAWSWWAPSQYDDGLIGIRKLPIRAQETLLRWEMDEGGGVQGMIQQDPLAAKTVPIPIDKALLFRLFSYKGNPEGRSLLSSAHESWYYKTHIRRIEGIGIERDLAGLFHARMPVQYMLEDASPGEKAIFEYIKNMGRSVHRDEQACLVTPLVYYDTGHELFKFELLSTGGTRQFDTTAIIQRFDTRILQTVLANVLMIGMQGRTGSYSLGETMSDLYSMGLSTILDSIVGVFNRHAVKRLWRLNALPPETMPTLAHGKVKQIDFDKFSTGVLRLSQAGLVFSPEDEAFIRSETGFPEMAEDAAF